MVGSWLRRLMNALRAKRWYRAAGASHDEAVTPDGLDIPDSPDTGEALPPPPPAPCFEPDPEPETLDPAAKKARDHFERFTGVRPRNISPDYPTYNPDRDYSQLANVIGNLFIKLQSQPVDFYIEAADLMGLSLFDTGPDGNPKLSGEATEALRAVVRFLEAGRGETIDGTVSIEDPAYLPSYHSALVKLLKPDRRGVVIILAMLGEQLIDMLFFAARQDRRLGREGKFTMGEAWPLFVQYSNAVLNEQPVEQVGYQQLRQAVRYLMSVGETETPIRDAVTRAIEDVNRRE